MTEGEPGTVYRPCNGDEGMWFMSKFCDRCVCEPDDGPDEGDDGCPIIAYAMALEETDENLSPMGIGQAIGQMKLGKAVARMGWNGVGMYLYYVPAASYEAQTDVAKSEFGYLVPYQAYVAMKTAQGTVVPWLASQTDLLAEDFVVVR